MNALLVLLALSTFAQSADPISGGAGWAGAGLLGLVLAWLLLKHLPDKDRMIRELLTEKDSQIGRILEQKWAAVEKLAADFKTSLKEVTEHCEREVTRIREASARDNERLVKAIESLNHKAE